MRVLMTPFFSGNPYQKLLIDSLDEDIKVFTHDSHRPLDVFLHRLVLDDIDVLHLHWIHPFFLIPDSYGERFDSLPFSSLVTAFFAIVFLFQVAVARLLCDRIVWTLHNEINHERRYIGIDRTLSLVLARLATVVQVWDEETCRSASSFLRLPRRRFAMVPHGHYCDLYSDLELHLDGTSARGELGLDTDDFVFLYFGRIRPYKQVPHLVETFERLGFEDATLVVAGNPDSERLAADVRSKTTGERVDLHLRHIPDEDVPSYFRAADAVVFPYEHIFNSGSVLLAMSFGRAFVAPPYGVIPTLDPGGNVLYESLAGGLREAYENTDAYERVGRRNRKHVLENHDWDDIGTEVRRIYRGQIENYH